MLFKTDEKPTRSDDTDFIDNLLSDALQSEDQMEQPVNKTDKMMIDELSSEEIDTDIETSIMTETSHRFICTFCLKVLSTKANKNYHERLCRRSVDDKASESNPKKRRLNEYTSVQIGGNDANKHPESWGNPQLIKSALNHTASIYRKEYDQENRKGCEQLLCLGHESAFANLRISLVELR